MSEGVFKITYTFFFTKKGHLNLRFFKISNKKVIFSDSYSSRSSVNNVFIATDDISQFVYLAVTIYTLSNYLHKVIISCSEWLCTNQSFTTPIELCKKSKCNCLPL